MKRFWSLSILFILAALLVLPSCSKEDVSKDTLLDTNAEAIAIEDVEMEDIENLISGQIESVTAGDIESFFPTANELIVERG